MSASFTASELSVPACTFNFSFSIRARSGCATVAQVCPGESNPSRKKDCSRIDPIFPAPNTATFFFPLKLCAMEFSQQQILDRDAACRVQRLRRSKPRLYRKTTPVAEIKIAFHPL